MAGGDLLEATNGVVTIHHPGEDPISRMVNIANKQQSYVKAVIGPSVSVESPRITLACREYRGYGNTMAEAVSSLERIIEKCEGA